jgi:hypothetical protein
VILEHIALYHGIHASVVFQTSLRVNQGFIDFSSMNIETTKTARRSGALTPTPRQVLSDPLGLGVRIILSISLSLPIHEGSEH